jgi:glycosyltransferase involved in cell wall biosynthesis
MISIITPVLNGEQFLKDNIESIKKLSIQYEHIIVDGGSTDGTIDLAQKYSHIKFLKQTEDSGMYGAIDLGIRNSKNEYVCWINCDDRIVLPGFETLVKFAKNTGVDIACSNGIFHYKESNFDKTVRGTRLAKYLLKKGLFPFSQPSVVFSKSVYDKVGGFDYKNFRISGDGDLFRRIAKLKNSKIGFVNVTSSIFVKHGNSLGDKNTSVYIQESITSNKPIPNLFDRGLLKLVRILHF